MILTGCAHNQHNIRKDGSFPNINLGVAMFHNETFQPGIEETLTNLVIDEFLADGRVHIVNVSKADYLVKGLVVHYNRSIAAVDRFDNTTLYAISIGADIEVWDLQNNKVIRKLSNVKIDSTYVPLRNNIDFETESEARRRVLEDLSEEIVFQLSEPLNDIE